MTKTKTEYRIMIGGGIGECLTFEYASTPLEAIAKWVKGNSERARWSAPLDCWLMADDATSIRRFYCWIMGHEDRLRDELYKQTAYVPEMLVMSALDAAVKYLKLSDDEMEDRFEIESLHPFSGG